MNELTIEITQYCPNSCSYCSSYADSTGKHLPKEAIFEFLKDKEPERINISGGEPLSHPDFYEILVYCNSICADVRVYTNAIKHIMFNADILTKVTVSANVVLIPNRKCFIPAVENIHLLRPVATGRLKRVYPSYFSLSGEMNDCLKCNHSVLQADGTVVKAPCKKNYEKASG